MSHTSVPRVSICLPSLNTGPYLQERIDSIQRQDMEDYEVIVVDDGSTDGSVELLTDWAARDDRVAFYDGPRQGMYAGWNTCLKHARGQYVYFATSDDTMSADCLSQSARYLDAYPDIDLCTFKIDIIDSQSRVIQHRWEQYPSVRFYDRYLSVPHRRNGSKEMARAVLLGTLYLSMTSLLIRRSLFSRTGLFPTGYGSTSDYLWQLTALSCTDVVFVPRKLATWRVYAGQATSMPRRVGHGRYHVRYAKLPQFSSNAEVRQSVRQREFSLFAQTEQVSYRRPLSLLKLFAAPAHALWLLSCTAHGRVPYISSLRWAQAYVGYGDITVLSAL